MKRIAFVMGTRPEVIKLAPVIKEAEARGHTAVIMAVGQHTTLLEQALKDFDLNPGYVIEIDRKTGTLDELLALELRKLDVELTLANPDVVVVQGDTMTTFAGALAAGFKGLPLVHVEAGLRTYDRARPFPEEMIRQMVARVTTVHCAPTQKALQYLKAENVQGQIVWTGNTVVDAVGLMTRGLSSKKGAKKIFMTLHRRENGLQEMDRIVSAVNRFCREHADWTVTFPCHPGTAKLVLARHKFEKNLRVTPPISYKDCLWEIMCSDFIVTDSGGIQEEAGVLGVPVLVCRDSTERAESVEADCSILVGSDFRKLQEQMLNMLDDSYRQMLNMLDDSYRALHSVKVKEYGDGRASARVIDEIERLK